MEKKSVREMIATVYKALTLVMGVGVVALSHMGKLEI